MARVLLIDDEELVRTLITRVLERAGHRVEATANGLFGLRAFAPGRFDIVITDILMPEMEGIETIRELRRQAPDLPILAISGGSPFSGTAFLRMAEQLGATSILAKPFEPEALTDAVAACLRKAAGGAA